MPSLVVATVCGLFWERLHERTLFLEAPMVLRVREIFLDPLRIIETQKLFGDTRRRHPE